MVAPVTLQETVVMETPVEEEAVTGVDSEVAGAAAHPVAVDRPTEVEETEVTVAMMVVQRNSERVSATTASKRVTSRETVKKNPLEAHLVDSREEMMTVVLRDATETTQDRQVLNAADVTLLLGEEIRHPGIADQETTPAQDPLLDAEIHP